MQKIPGLLRTILRDFCHVEWWEVDELAEAIKSGSLKFDVPTFEQQLNELILSDSVPIDEINALTRNDFESQSERVGWVERSETQQRSIGLGNN